MQCGGYLGSDTLLRISLFARADDCGRLGTVVSITLPCPKGRGGPGSRGWAELYVLMLSGCLDMFP